MASLGAVARAVEHECVCFASFEGEDGPRELQGLLFRPAAAGARPAAAVVAMHGCGGLYAKTGELTGRHRQWAEVLTAAGYVVLFVDSFRPRGLREICTQKARTIRQSRERTRDAFAGLRYLAGRPDVDGARVGLLGWSHGAGSVLFALREGAGRGLELAHDFAAAVAFYPGCSALGAAAYRPRAPILLLVGEADDWTPAEPCVEFVGQARAAGAAIDLRLYPGAHHYFDAPDLAVKTREGLATPPEGRATVGTHPEARRDALARVPEFLSRHLNGGNPWTAPC
ncbi:MAG: dienelactone hydrolase family protein [Alphaproteobacteria bacterium]|nr:dienelactone hydrolase family protein [Alphaproteobacteria bacterium]